ncbi:MAG TPA: 2-dehydropantoate 2-reductase [Thermoplasmata archaeon]|nr:2-dehydropantoate 2-reductase [Thermoplasmata archaeon]
MKILVFGAGAVGGVLGALLSRRQDVLLVTRGEHLEAIKSGGLTIDGVIKKNFRIDASDSSSLGGKYDLILVTVKAYATGEAASACKNLLDDEGVVLTIQNGLGNAEKLAAAFGRERVVAGVTSLAAHRVKPGTIEYVAEGSTSLGTLDGGSGPIEKVEDALDKAGIKTEPSQNIVGAIWSKTIVNAAINPLTAVFDCRNGLVAENVAIRAQAIKVCGEGMKVAEGLGIRLEPEEVIEYTFEVAKRTANNKSSMLMDIELKRRTEIDAICGSIIESGRSKGVETPVISRLYAIVKFMESRDSILRKLNMQT